jgi:hypothetical protein
MMEGPAMTTTTEDTVVARAIVAAVFERINAHDADGIGAPTRPRTVTATAPRR